MEPLSSQGMTINFAQGASGIQVYRCRNWSSWRLLCVPPGLGRRLVHLWKLLFLKFHTVHSLLSSRVRATLS